LWESQAHQRPRPSQTACSRCRYPWLELVLAFSPGGQLLQAAALRFLPVALVLKRAALLLNPRRNRGLSCLVAEQLSAVEMWQARWATLAVSIAEKGSAIGEKSGAIAGKESLDDQRVCDWTGGSRIIPTRCCEAVHRVDRCQMSDRAVDSPALLGQVHKSKLSCTRVTSMMTRSGGSA
jgi:hypothetical protein